MLIWVKDEHQCLERLETILKVFEHYGVIVSLDKLQAGRSVTWTGYHLQVDRDDGPVTITPSQDKIQAINKFPTLTTRT